jgi:hypothetical protein
VVQLIAEGSHATIAASSVAVTTSFPVVCPRTRVKMCGGAQSPITSVLYREIAKLLAIYRVTVISRMVPS